MLAPDKEATAAPAAPAAAPKPRPLGSPAVTTAQPPLTASVAATRASDEAFSSLLAPGAPVATDATLGGLLGAAPAHTPFRVDAVATAQQQLEDALSGKDDPKVTVYGGRGAGSAVVQAAAGVQRQHDDNVDSAEATLDDALRSQRVHAIGGDRHGDKHHGVVTDYSKADSPLQLAAVDFNRMLKAAVAKDRRQQDTLPSAQSDTDPFHDTSTQERKTYDAAVEKMFGQDAEHLQYAPETVALLRQIGFQDDSASLDDFTSGRAGIPGRLLDNLGKDRTSAREDEMNPVRADRIELADALAQGTAAIEQKLAAGHQILKSVPASLAVERGEDLGFLGGQAQQPKPALGFQAPKYDASGIPQDLNAYFQTAFERLADKSRAKDQDTILSALSQDLTPEEIDMFKGYAAARTANAERFDVPLGANAEVTYRSPEEFRKILGLGKDG